MHAEFRLHGRVLVAAAAGVMLGISALPAFVLGVFAGPMTREFGWSLGAYQAGTLVFTVGVLACSPWVGGLCDRHGARAVACIGMPLSALGIAGFALVQPGVWSWYVAMLLAAVLSAGTVPAVWTRMVNALFVERLGPSPTIFVACALIALAIVLGRRAQQLEYGVTSGREQGRDRLALPVGGRAIDDLRRLFTSPYLLAIAALIVGGQVLGGFMYQEQAKYVESAYQTLAERAALFARIDLAVSLLALVFQAGVVGLVASRGGCALPSGSCRRC